MAVQEGNTVKVVYEGYFDDGEVFDSTERNGGASLEFTVGAHQVIPVFENSVIGKEINQEYKIRLEPKDAYGEYHPEAVQVVSAKEFPPEIVPKEGLVLQVQQKHEDHEHTMPVWITKVENEEVTLDFNHPMAGKILNFKITVKEIIQL